MSLGGEVGKRRVGEGREGRAANTDRINKYSFTAIKTFGENNLHQKNMKIDSYIRHALSPNARIMIKINSDSRLARLIALMTQRKST